MKETNRRRVKISFDIDLSVITEFTNICYDKYGMDAIVNNLIIEWVNKEKNKK